MSGLRLSAPELAATSDVAAARELLTRWAPPSPEQAAARGRIVAFIDEHPHDAHLRTCVPGHLTASALLLDHTGRRVLLTHHAKLRRWLQLGGHCDGDANLAACALRECVEESGIGDLTIDPAPIDVDVHPIPAHGTEPEHLHLDVRFVVRAPAGARETCSHESLELRWFDRDELEALDLDDSVRRLFRHILTG